MALSHAVVLFIAAPDVPLAQLKQAFAREHGAGANFTFYSAGGVSFVRAALDQMTNGDDPTVLIEAAQALAKELDTPVGRLWRVEGAVDEMSAMVFLPEGEARTVTASHRVTAAARALAKTSGLELLSMSDAQRLDERPDGTMTPAELPYWMLHALFRLGGKRPHLDLEGRPALEVVADWTVLEVWSRPRTAQELAEERLIAAEEKSLQGRLDQAVGALAKMSVGHQVLSVDADSAVGQRTQLVVITAASLQAAIEAWVPRSTVVRLSPLGRRTALRRHADAVAFSTSVEGRLFEVEELLPAAVDAHFPGVREAVEADPDPDFEANAWNSLTELSPDDVLTAALEKADSLFLGNLRPQLTEYLSSEAASFAPLIVQRLLADAREYWPFRWVLTEPSVKSLGRERAYVEALGTLAAREPSDELRAALALVSGTKRHQAVGPRGK